MLLKHFLLVSVFGSKNFNPIFHHLWTKIHKTKYKCMGNIAFSNAIFRLTTFCYIRHILFLSEDINDQVMKLSELEIKF